MAEFPVAEFVSLLSDFLQDKVGTTFIVSSSTRSGRTNRLRHIRKVEELRMTFLAGPKDEPQFLLSKAEVQSILDKVHTSSKPS